MSRWYEHWPLDDAFDHGYDDAERGLDSRQGTEDAATYREERYWELYEAGYLAGSNERESQEVG